MVRDDALGAQRVWGIERKRKVANDTEGTYHVARAACLNADNRSAVAAGGKV